MRSEEPGKLPSGNWQGLKPERQSESAAGMDLQHTSGAFESHPHSPTPSPLPAARQLSELTRLPHARGAPATSSTCWQTASLRQSFSVRLMSH